MISLLLFFLTIFISGIIVRVGAVALELTGLPEEQASFQALSAFSGVGYTTKEAEFILSHPQRRKIIGKLIDIGSAGVITMIGTLGGVIFSTGNIMKSLSKDGLFPWLPLNGTQLFLIIVVLIFFIAYKAAHTPSLSRLLKEIVASFLLKGHIVNPTSFEEVLANGNGYGIYQIELTQNNPMAGKSGRELNLKDLDVQVLFLTRKSESFNNLSETFQMEEGDVVTVFGPTTVIFDRCCDLKTVEQERVRKEKQKDAPLALLEKAPSFSLKDQDGEQRRLDDYLGKKNLVLVFYPKDKSFFCTTQLKSFNDALDSIRVFDTEVLAINNESEKSHAGFCDSSHLDFPLLSDKKRQACKAYKTLMLGGLLVDRTVYVIDKKGFIRFAQRGKPPVRDVLAILKQLQEEKVTN